MFILNAGGASHPPHILLPTVMEQQCEKVREGDGEGAVPQPHW